MSGRPLIAVVAGEASGDQLGAALIHALRRRRPDLEFAGVAGPAMQAAGCTAWHGIDELSVMGLAEVVRHLPRLLSLRRALVARLLTERPAAFVGIDSPDFNLRVAPVLRAAGVRVIQYVCPSVWAWRPGRVRVIARACDHVLCLFPFEPPFLARSGIAATFVGHPFADQIAADASLPGARGRLGLAAETVIGLLPGSRVEEVRRLGPDFLRAARAIHDRLPGAAFVAPMANPPLREIFEPLVSSLAPGCEVLLLDGRAREAIAASDALVLASGTVTLEAMLVNRPMVVAYRVAPLTYWLARRLDLVSVRHFALPNLLAGEALVPELLQDEVTPDSLAAAALDLLTSPDRRRELHQRFAQLGDSLRRGASDRAAEVVLDVAGLG